MSNLLSRLLTLRLMILLPFLLFQVFAIATASARPAYRLGVHYDVIDPPQRVFARAKGAVEVVEVFWYGCRSCYAIQKVLSDWRLGQRAAIEFFRLPAVTEEAMMPMARAFFSARQLGVDEQMHTPLFTAIHAFRQRLESAQEIAAFFARHGVPRDDFMAAWRSNRVSDGLRQARVMGRRYGLRGVPTIVVNGRYRVDASQVSGAEQLIDIVDYLVSLERTAPDR